MKKLACALIALLPLSAFAYPIDVERQLNGAEVSVSTQEVDHNIGAVVLYNYGQSQAQCSAVFRNGPEAPRTRKVSLEPGASSNLTMKFARSIIRLRVELTCGI
ncbi:MAG: 3-phosphoglycerate kinase [Gammaproteobacteria bacterium]|nr:3-phosphoglycerate kinase [Gammaproteobacteria bacterium]MBU1488154.1 3-phosphoglycerate kinase [Gammaproteobacteria bacterium]MBU2066165.1 3-phosphoglycerate kinase [Gammaproteobacteria bacterium]MBU2139452.1 3-phosphoglycerate kinase [Gammaproteobacteria bacterium]MBU2215706.1 3-phosphoglycerate kinase [Gammaproteobacteria bacterium]